MCVFLQKRHIGAEQKSDPRGVLIPDTDQKERTEFWVMSNLLSRLSDGNVRISSLLTSYFHKYGHSLKTSLSRLVK